MNLIEVMERFPDQESCIEHLERIRWRGTLVCPHCGSISIVRKKEEGGCIITYTASNASRLKTSTTLSQLGYASIFAASSAISFGVGCSPLSLPKISLRG